MNLNTDTIAAIATPPGEGGIGVVRMSGPESVKIGLRLFRPGQKKLSQPESHKLYYGKITDSNGRIIDEGMMVFMLAPKSYTREDVAEFHTHGGPEVVKSVLRAIVALGARPAEPGEFSKRAFLNGRLDLLQAESVIELIRSKSETAARLAAESLDGKLSGSVAAIKNKLADAMAQIEAGLDFPDDEISPDETAGLIARIQDVRRSAMHAVESFDFGRILRDGPRVVIIGKPNAGKSSLLNRLLESDRAIVTPHPGTTRDTVEEQLIFGGYSLNLVDTAGLRDTADPVESIGIERTRDALLGADVVVALFDSSAPFTGEDSAVTEAVRNSSIVIPVINKTDLSPVSDKSLIDGIAGLGHTYIPISCVTGAGLDQLKLKIIESIENKYKYRPGEFEGFLVTRERHRDIFRRIADSAGRAITSLENNLSPEFAADDLAAALDAVKELTGESIAEDILDKIFSEFCIGK